MVRILVTGSRKWTARELIRQVLLDTVAGRFKEFLVIHGGCGGADLMAESVCDELGIHTAKVNARWGKYGKPAGPLRNRVMHTLEPSLILVFHDDFENSKGTKDCVNSADTGQSEVRYYSSRASTTP